MKPKIKAKVFLRDLARHNKTCNQAVYVILLSVNDDAVLGSDQQEFVARTIPVLRNTLNDAKKTRDRSPTLLPAYRPSTAMILALATYINTCK